jgi:hypothetical protein
VMNLIMWLILAWLWCAAQSFSRKGLRTKMMENHEGHTVLPMVCIYMGRGGRSACKCQWAAFGAPFSFGQLSQWNGELIPWTVTQLDFQQISCWWLVETSTRINEIEKGRVAAMVVRYRSSSEICTRETNSQLGWSIGQDGPSAHLGWHLFFFSRFLFTHPNWFKQIWMTYQRKDKLT